MLLGASLLFYTWGGGALVSLLIISTAVDYAMGRVVASGLATGNRSRVRLGVTGSVLVNVALLSYFNERVLRLPPTIGVMAAALSCSLLLSLGGRLGLGVERIWTLARGKGNSSQQMGAHGRQELRKCVYVWKKKN